MKRILLYAAQPYAVEIMRPLQHAARERGCEAYWFFETSDSGAHLLRNDELQLSSVSAVKTFDPEAIFVPGNTVPDFFPGIKVGIFHGFNVNKRDEQRGHFRIRGFFDLYCTQGPATTEPFQVLSKQHGHFSVVETGWPKLDPLFASTVQAIAVPANKPTILYTSTFTPRLSSARLLHQEIQRLAERGNWHWLVTLHPKMDAKVVEMYSALAGPNLQYFPPGDILTLFKSADLMVADTSSTIPEFLLQNKPVITFRNQKPDVHLLNVVDPGDLEMAIQKGLSRPAKLMAAIERYGEAIHPLRDGLSSERVLDAAQAFIENKSIGNLRRKPLNIMRKAKIRKALKYYRIW